MTTTEVVAALSLILGGGILFYLANHFRQQRGISIYELLFAFANLFVLSALWVIYSVLQAEYSGLSSVAMALFNGFLWIYFIIFVIIVLKTLTSTLALVASIAMGATKGKRRWP